MGEASAVRGVYAAIHEGRPTNDLLAVKYIEALKGIADGRATKVFLPADMSGILGSVAGVAELFNNNDNDDSIDADPTGDGGPEDGGSPPTGGAVPGPTQTGAGRSVLPPPPAG